MKVNWIALMGLSLLTFGQLQGSVSPLNKEWGSLVRPSSCGVQTDDENILVRSDFRWNQPLDEMMERSESIYQEGKRLKRRAYIDEELNIVIPMENLHREERKIRLTPLFIASIRRHIEEALRLGYVDSITFSDMGHSHFFIPQDFYNDELAVIPIADRDVMYEKMLAHKDLKVLYHTAEQLKMFDEDRKLLENRHLQWRFYTRNLVGDNKGEGRLEFIHQEDHSYNTARGTLEGHRYWGAGFYINANKEGCFPFTYEGKTYYFDLNLEGMDLGSSGF